MRGEDARTVQRLIAGFLLCSVVLSVILLRFRNLFDDEIFSLPFVTGPVRDIFAMAREGDVHPPGMYLLAHVAWQAVHSYRWLNLLPLAILYAGLAVFLLDFVPLLRGRRAAVICVLLATLHPELLMWSNTLRWYCPWTGLALLALVIFLQPARANWKLGWGRAIVGGLLLAGMFYLNYITLLFAVALAPAVVVRGRNRDGRVSVGPPALAAAVFLCLIAPQIRTLISVHLPNSTAQRSGVAISSVRLVQALAGSEAYVPWHPLAIVAGLVLLMLLARGFVAAFQGVVAAEQQSRDAGGQQWLRALAAFAFTFLLLVALTGLGGKPRSAMVLVPVLAPLAGVGAAKMRESYQGLTIALLAGWCALGAAHLIGRFGLAKSSRDDRPEQVVSLVAREQGDGASGERCGVAITYDGGVAFALAEARIPGLMIVSPYRGALFAGTLLDLPERCAHPRVYAVESYVSGEPDRDSIYRNELNAAEQFVGQPRSVEELSPDRDAPMKRRLSRIFGLSAGTSLPDYRFVVLSGPIDRRDFSELRRTLHYFVSGEEVVPDWPSEGDDESR